MRASAGQPAQAAPWLKQGRDGRLSWPGTVETGEPGDLTSGDHAPRVELARWLARQAQPLKLVRVPLGSPSLSALRQAYRGRGWMRVHADSPSPFIELNRSWEEAESQFNAGRRSDFRRAQRRAHEAGGLAFEVHAPQTGAELESLLDQAYAVEARSWKGQGGTALAKDPTLGPFYRDLSRCAAAQGLLRLCFLRIGGQPAAMQLALQADQRFWLMKIGYDPAYARCSPGQLLMLHTIGHAAAQGLASYEMLGSAAPWTAGWTRTLRPFVRVQAYPASWAGARAAWGDVSQAAARRWRAWAGRTALLERPA
jgi:hypothetical protein